MPEDGKQIRDLLERLAGQKAPLATTLPPSTESLLSSGGSGLGYSQLNELLLLLGFDRVTRAFFQYLVDGTTQQESGSGLRAIASLASLEEGIDRFRRTALLLYGNVKFAYKVLSRDAELLSREIDRLQPLDETAFTARHEPVQPIEYIPTDKTYYLGYIVAGELQTRLKKNPNDNDAKAQEATRQEVVAQGIRNHEAYLASDHLDVYVATSMRERHEFAAVGRLTKLIFEHPDIKALKLRWFDPTQAYCADRIDKGLAEALMLRRADCTIYLAQESDTLGKDSELASTLAQGKPVIAFVPKVDREYVQALLKDLKATYPEKSEEDLVLSQLKLFETSAAWEDAQIRTWLSDPKAMDLEEAKARLEAKIVAHYDKRASTLKESHPLGIQVNLATGVANGVLVVRTADQCARLIRRIVTRTLEFDLEMRGEYTFLRERISDSIFRVMTGDVMLTNAFWNFYLEPKE